MGREPPAPGGLGRLTWLLVMLAGWMVIFHLAEITVWAFVGVLTMMVYFIFAMALYLLPPRP